MPPGVGIEGGYTHQPVYAALRFQETIGKGAVELDRGAFDAGAFPVLDIEFRDAPPLFFPVHAVHAQQHFSPILAFGAAGPGIDLHDARQFVLGLVEGTFEFGFFDQADGLIVGFARLLLDGFPAFPEIEKYGKILHGAFH